LANIHHFLILKIKKENIFYRVYLYDGYTMSEGSPKDKRTKTISYWCYDTAGGNDACLDVQFAYFCI